MKPASTLQILMLSIWVLAQLIFCGFAALFLSTWMGLHFDSIHTSGTAMNPIEDLTRETVLQNIWAATWRFVWLAPVAAAVVYFISDVLWEHWGKTGKRIALFSGLTCMTILLAGIVYADVHCYLKYPQR